MLIRRRMKKLHSKVQKRQNMQKTFLARLKRVETYFRRNFLWIEWI